VQRDVTRELQMEEQHRQSQKMEAVGLLAGGIAHDFNNLLTAINGFAEMAQFELPPGDPAQELLGQILKAGLRATELVRQLLAFSRKQMIQPRVLDLNRVVADMSGMLRRLIGEDISLVTVPALDLGCVKADRTQIEQVILNLGVNARDAMPGGGTLTIETANVELPADHVIDRLAVPAGDYVRLSISDTGAGMTPEIQARIFEPFFTTKGLGRGTGLGLSTVYGIVRQSGGDIDVCSEVDCGAVFHVYLPRVAAELPAPAPEAAAPVPLGLETVLLAEDEESVRDLAAHTLRKQGYEVLVASNGDEALRMARSADGTIHLLLTDVIMPGMNGRELAERLAAERPALKVLYTSGYNDGVIGRHGILAPGVAFVPKPFSPRDLARRVREVLDAP
jgi:two-component system cell cycle sensor histidine kinase/response regulator CckA